MNKIIDWVIVIIAALGVVFLIGLGSSQKTATTAPPAKLGAVKENLDLKLPTATGTIPKTEKKITAPRPPANKETLEQIQDQINQAARTLKDIENAPTLPPRLSQPALYDRARPRVVNLLCEVPNTSRVVVASGALISASGHVLTNAHVAEDFTNIKDYECLIRQGSPARSVGYAKLVLFPQAFGQAQDRRTQSENDISVWQLVRSPGETPLLETFSFFEIKADYVPKTGQPLATFSYASELLGFETLLKSLNLLFSETTVSEFDQNFILSKASLSSQMGSSGGVLVDVYSGDLAGLIFAVDTQTDISKRTLFSLTPAAIERIVKQETGKTLTEFLAHPSL